MLGGKCTTRDQHHCSKGPIPYSECVRAKRRCAGLPGAGNNRGTERGDETDNRSVGYKDDNFLWIVGKDMATKKKKSRRLVSTGGGQACLARKDFRELVCLNWTSENAASGSAAYLRTRMERIPFARRRSRSAGKTPDPIVSSASLLVIPSASAVRR